MAAAARQALTLHQSMKYHEKNLTSNQLLKFFNTKGKRWVFLQDYFFSFYIDS